MKHLVALLSTVLSLCAWGQQQSQQPEVLYPETKRQLPAQMLDVLNRGPRGGCVYFFFALGEVRFEVKRCIFEHQVLDTQTILMERATRRHLLASSAQELTLHERDLQRQRQGSRVCLIEINQHYSDSVFSRVYCPGPESVVFLPLGDGFNDARFSAFISRAIALSKERAGSNGF